MVEYPVNLTFNSDRQSLKKVEKDVQKSASKGANASGGGGAAFAGGALGGLFGSLLSSVEQLFAPLSAVASLLVASLWPILKPFLILFLKIGIKLNKWLQSALAGFGLGTGAGGVSVDSEGIVQAGEKIKSAFFLIGAILSGVVAAFAGAGPLLIGAVAILGGLIVSKVYSILIEKFLSMAKLMDELWGSNLLEPIMMIFNGIADTFMGLWNMVMSLLTLDWEGFNAGFTQMWNGALNVFKGILLLAWETFKAYWTKGIETLKTVGNWMFEFLKERFTQSFQVLKDIGSWIRDRIKGFFSRLNPFGGGSSKSVNDAIITPNGDVIRTNPSDYLIATKTPESLGGMGGKGGTVNVNINGGLITEDVANQIGAIIQRQINFGGGY